MVRLSTKYDEELKEQVFMIRGDEDYARSTAVEISHGTPTTGTTNFSVDITVNVLRDRGESSIVIYDDESVLAIIDDWKDTDTGRTITVNNLNYDVEHIFHAKYMGNNKCSPGVSKKIPLSIHDSRITTLSFSGGNQFNPDTSISKTITMGTNQPASAEYIIDQEILVYYDNVLIDTVRTDIHGQADISLNSGDKGLHELRAEYAGSLNLTPQVKTMQIGVGLNIDVIEAPEVMIKGKSYNVRVRVCDMFNKGLVFPTVNVSQYVEGQYVSVGSKSADRDGYVTIPLSNITYTNEASKFKFDCVGTFEYSSMTAETIVEIPTLAIIGTNLDVDSTPLLVKDGSLTFSAFVENHGISDVPINIQVTNPSEERTIYTNSNGYASFDILGYGKGERKVTARCGNASSSITASDCLEYWDGNYQRNKRYKAIGLNVLSLANYFRLDISNNIGLLGFNELSSGDYTLILEGVTSDNPCDVWMLDNWNGDEYGWTITDAPVNPTSNLNKTHIQVIKEGTTVRLYINNQLVKAWENQSSSKPCLAFICNNTTKITHQYENGLTSSSFIYKTTKITFNRLIFYGGE